MDNENTAQTCSRCGNVSLKGAKFCAACGGTLPDGKARAAGTRPAATGATAPHPEKRPLSFVVFLSRFHWIAFGVLMIGANASITLRVLKVPLPLWLTLGLTAEAVFCVLAAIGLGKLQSFGRIFMLIEACVLLLLVPIGTVAGLFILRYFSRTDVRALFSGKKPASPAPAPAVPAAGPERFPTLESILYLLSATSLFLNLSMMPLFLTGGFPSAADLKRGPVLASVGDDVILAKDFRRQLERTLSSYSSATSMERARLINEMGLPSMLLSQMIDHRLLLRSAKDHKIKASKAEVQKKIMEYPAFQSDGKFIGLEQYREILVRNNLSVADFEKSLEEEIKLQKLVDHLAGGVPEGRQNEIIGEHIKKLREQTTIKIDNELLSAIVSQFR